MSRDWPLEYLLGLGKPDWLPTNLKTEGDDQIPCLKAFPSSLIPSELISLGDEKRAKNIQRAGVHFYRSDARNLPLLVDPARFLEPIQKFGCVLTPDISIGIRMPRWRRAAVTSFSRTIGVYFESRGIPVLPSIRALEPKDYDFLAAGIQPGSAIAFGSYSLQRNDVLRRRFEHGVHAMIERLQPEAVLIYGSIRPLFQAQIESKTDLRRFLHPMAEHRTKEKDHLYPPALFDPNERR